MVAVTHRARLISIEAEGQTTKSRLLAGADVVFDPGVGQWRASSVGDHELVTPAVDLFDQRQLRARVWLLAPADDAQVGWPVRQLAAIGVLPEQGGQHNDPGLGQVAGLAVGGASTVQRDQQARRYRMGIWVIASSSTSM
jgi:hypothetical protein